MTCLTDVWLQCYLLETRLAALVWDCSDICSFFCFAANVTEVISRNSLDEATLGV